jgi:2-hydroxychromene-2-carboxylate isomerase
MSDHASEPAAFEFTAPLSVCVDVKHPLAYLALGPVRALAAELAVDVDWLPFPVAPLQAPPAAGAPADRGTRHRRIRARYLGRDIERYAAVQALTIRGLYRAPDSTPASLGLLWLRARAPEHVAECLERLFAGYWQEQLDVEDPNAVAGVLAALGQDPAQFAAFAEGPGPAELASLRARLVAAGVFAVPSLVVEGEVFVGRAHLPMARWLLQGRTGAPPI